MTTSRPLSFTVKYRPDDALRDHLLDMDAGHVIRYGCAAAWGLMMALVALAIMLKALRPPIPLPLWPEDRISRPVFTRQAKIWTAAAGAAAAGYLLYLQILLKRRRQRIAAMPPFEMTFTHEGHRAVSPAKEYQAGWSRYRYAEEDARRFVLVTDTKVLKRFIIPKHAIPDADTAEQLRTLIEEHVGPIAGRPAPPEESS